MSPSHAWYHGQTLLRDYQAVFPATNSRTLTSPPIDLRGISGVEISFRYFLETEHAPGLDVAPVAVSRDGFASDVSMVAPQLSDPASFAERHFDLSGFAGTAAGGTIEIALSGGALQIPTVAGPSATAGGDGAHLHRDVAGGHARVMDGSDRRT